MELITKASFSDEITPREKANRKTAYTAACESAVLLKNDGTLPLKNKRIAAFGAGVSHTVKGGTGSGEVNERYSVSIYDGLRNRGFEIATESWIRGYAEKYRRAYNEFCESRLSSLNFLKITDLMNQVLKGFQPPEGNAVDSDTLLSSGTDTCIYVVSRQAGEGGDRKPEKGDYCLSDTETEDIRLCAAYFSNFVLILNCGSVMDLSVLDEVDGINAVIYISQLGMEGGNAVADILSGAVVPSGKLADTWPKSYSDIPFGESYSSLNGNLQNEDYNEGIYVGYRYFDTFHVEPRFRFGYGLSYTDFEISDYEISVVKTQVTLRCRVKNTGNFAGKEVVQVYVSSPSGKLSREYQSLAGFAKTGVIEPGESEPVEILFDIKQTAGYSFDDAGYILEKGRYTIRAGNCSADTVPVAVIAIQDTVQITRNDHICPLKTALSELEAPETENEEYIDVPAFTMDRSLFITETYAYRTPDICADKKATDFVDRLSLKEMIDVVVGAGMNAEPGKFNLPGSVGNTTSGLWKKGLVNATLCDGPAGLRIQRKSGVNSKGKVKPYEFALSILAYLPKKLTAPMLAGDKDTPVYQYCTAFPVASALAQTWNTDLMYKVGDAVLSEMKEYGCVFWLAPAINIHRNPLCGRNFEYFSEDPLLTGKMAAALVRGVQQEPGYYVTIKHFACNNQEDNRNKVSSNVSERTLREIYLRAFEICIKEAGAASVMTSYNKVNGVYSPNSHDLCTKVLRNEWGFDGVVMTDWLSTAPGLGSSALAMSAGNDLIMPGGAPFKADIYAGIANRKISKEHVKRCCINVVKAIMASSIQKEYMEK